VTAPAEGQRSRLHAVARLAAFLAFLALLTAGTGAVLFVVLEDVPCTLRMARSSETVDLRGLTLAEARRRAAEADPCLRLSVEGTLPCAPRGMVASPEGFTTTSRVVDVYVCDG
jgi:uncharacterized protein YbjT (DUF2867 family)